MIIRNSILYGITSILKGALGVALLAVFTRLLSPAADGDYAVIMAIAMLLDLVAFSWVRHAVFRNVNEHSDQEQRAYFTQSILIMMALGGAFCALGFLASALEIISMPASNALYGLIGFLVIAEAFSSSLILFARIQLRHALFMVLSILKPALALLWGAMLIIQGLSVSGALLGFIISGFVVSMCGVLFLRAQIPLSGFKFDKQIIKKIAAFGLPLIFVLSLQMAVKATDRIALDILIGGEITGLYAAAQDIPFKLLALVMGAVHLAAYPLAVRAYDNEGEEACRAQISQNFTLLLGIGLPAALGMALVSPALISLFMGEAFRSFAGQSFGIFVALAFLNSCIQYYLALPFHITKQTHKLLWPFGIAFVLNLVLACVLIPSFGYWGAIVGSAAAYIFAGGSTWLAGRAIFKLPFPFLSILKIFIASKIMFFIVAIYEPSSDLISLTVATALGVFVYALALICLNIATLKNYMRPKHNE
ncbi:MAG: lipopolysaccharide biosynthesis protein [Pseudomonadota bacterium]